MLKPLFAQTESVILPPDRCPEAPETAQIPKIKRCFGLEASSLDLAW